MAKKLDTSAIEKPEATMDRIQGLIEDVVQAESWGVLRTMTEEHLGNRGRFFRARLALEGGQCLGVEASLMLPFAAACELVHNASLIHDDVQDGDG